MRTRDKDPVVGSFSTKFLLERTCSELSIVLELLKIFAPKNLAKILAFFSQTTALVTLVFEKNSNFFAEN
jgi:hypothetical protein